MTASRQMLGSLDGAPLPASSSQVCLIPMICSEPPSRLFQTQNRRRIQASASVADTDAKAISAGFSVLLPVTKTQRSCGLFLPQSPEEKDRFLWQEWLQHLLGSGCTST